MKTKLIIIIFFSGLLFLGKMFFPSSVYATNYYWVGDSGNLNDSAHWSSSSGGLGGAGVPGATDDAYFDANSFTTTGQRVTITASQSFHNLDWTGATNNPDFSRSVSSTITIKGNLTYISAMTIGGGLDGAPNTAFSAVDSGTYYIDSQGKSLRGASMAGNYVLTSNMSFTGNTLTQTSGTLDTNGYAVNILRYTPSSGVTITLGSSTFTVGWEWNYSNANINVNAGTSTIVVSGSGGSPNGAFNGAGKTYYNVQLNGATHTVTGSNTFNDLKLNRSGVQTITFTDGTTQTVTTFTRDSGTSVKTLQRSATGSWSIAKANGGVNVIDYLSISYSNASPANTFSASTHSTDSGNNSGWIFGNLGIIAGKGQDAYQLQMDSSRNITGYIANSASGSTQVTSGWHHVVMTYDGSNIKIYVDGVLQVTTTKTGAIGTNTNNFKIGSGIAGKIDNVRIHNRALSQAEVTAAYDSYNPGIVMSDLQKGLVGQWKMDGTAKDATPNVNHGTVSNATLAADRKGATNKAYSFNAVNSLITLGGPVLTPSAITVSFWWKRTGDSAGADPTYHHVLNSLAGASGANANAFYVYKAGDNAFFRLTIGGATKDVTMSGLNVAGWNHLVGTWDGSNMYGYVNGVATAPLSASGALTTGTTALRIGRLTNYVVNGVIDDLRIWNRALSQAEITALYQSY